MKDKDWKELGVKPKLGKEWKLVMDRLWMVSQLEFKKSAKNVENEIHIGKWRIYSNFINSDYINVVVTYGEEERLEIRHTNNNLTSILICVFELITRSYKTPLK